MYAADFCACCTGAWQVLRHGKPCSTLTSACNAVMPSSIHLSVLNNGGLETLGVGDVDGLHVGVELLLGVLLVVTLTGDADAEAEGNALDTALPDLLVQLGVETDVGGTLEKMVSRENG